MIQKNISRRHFLASSSALIPLPFLESLMAQSKTGKSIAPPKRMIFLGTGFGFTEKGWYPDKNTVGENYELPVALKPLARHKKSFTIVQNLYHKFSRNGHSGSTFWLTGANQFEVPGKSFHNTVSVDQVAAAKLGQQTRFTSIQLSGKKTAGAGSGHGPGLSLSWDERGKPISSYQTPLEAFHKLFVNENIPIAESQARIASKRSVLDTVLADAQTVGHRVSHTDGQKLKEYFESIRDIEIRLAKEESWLGTPRKKPKSISEPSSSLKGAEEIRMMYDIMIAAMQVDATRVFTYRMPADALVQSIGLNDSAHVVSHKQNLSLKNAQVSIPLKRDIAHSTMLAEFFDKLKKSKESDGSSLFDNSVITFGSNLSSMHNLTNCPSLVAGGGLGIKQGRHLVMKNPKTPLCNLWLTLLRGTGIKADSFGDSTGVIKELI